MNPVSIAGSTCLVVLDERNLCHTERLVGGEGSNVRLRVMG
jgi:hypothetical protein